MRNLWLCCLLLCSCAAQGDPNGDGDGGGGDGGGGGGGGGSVTPVSAGTLAYAARDSSGNDTITLLDLADPSHTTHPILAVGEAVTGIAISPDRTTIAFSTESAVQLVGVDGSNPHTISDPIPSTGANPDLGFPEWTPDSSTLYLGLGFFTSDGGTLSGGTNLADLPATGGMVSPVANARADCSLIDAPKIAADGSFGLTIHESCLDDSQNGVWKHAPDGTGALLVHDDSLAIAKPMLLPDGTILAVHAATGGANGIAVIQNAAIATTLQPPSGLSMDYIAVSPDGVTLVAAMHDLQTFVSNVYTTTDLQTYTQLTTDGHDLFVTF